MLRLKKLMEIVLIICLSSCALPKIRNLEQKNLRLVTERDPINKRLYILEDQSACFSREYEHSIDFIGSRSDMIEYSIEHCHDMIGYDSADYIELFNFLEESRNRLKGIGIR